MYLSIKNKQCKVKINVGWSVSKVKVTHGAAESKDRGTQGQSHETSNYVNGRC